jgi:outer membrane protein
VIKNIILAFAAAAILVTPAVASAQQLKIGYIIVPKLVAESKAGVAAAKELKTRLDKAQGGIDTKLKEIKDLEVDIEKRLMVLSEEERQKVMEEHERQMRAAKRMREDFQRELSKVETEVMGRVNEFLRGVIEKYAVDNDYDLVLDAGTLLYISKKADVTEGVLVAADKAFKG